MDLIDSLSNEVNISEVTVKTAEVFDEVSDKFDDFMFLAFSSIKQLQDLLPKLIDECGDVDSYDEWEPQMYLNFKDLVITPKGIRGLTDGFWSWGLRSLTNVQLGIFTLICVAQTIKVLPL